MNTQLVNIWTEGPGATAANDQAVQNAKGEFGQSGIDEGPDNDATNLDESKDRWWLYREAARLGLSFDLFL